MAKSIYGLSRQLLDMGVYPEGSETASFLQQLVNDADALGQSSGDN